MPTLPYRYPYVLFDLGSTLIYLDGNDTDRWAEATHTLASSLVRLGYALDEAEFAAFFLRCTRTEFPKRDVDYMERSSRVVLEMALRERGYPHAPAADLTRALADFYAVMQVHWFPEAETPGALAELRRQGYRLGIVSNAADDADVQTLVDRAQIRPYFDFVLSSAVAGVRKPHPLIFRRALAHWNAQPSQAVMVGDLLGADVLGARHLGMKSVWITRRAGTAHNHEREGKIIPMRPLSPWMSCPDCWRCGISRAYRV